MSRLSHLFAVVGVVLTAATCSTRAAAQAAGAPAPAKPPTAAPASAAPSTPAAAAPAAAPSAQLPATPPTAAGEGSGAVQPPPTAAQPAAPAAEPPSLGEQPGGVVYAEPDPDRYGAGLPDWAQAQCPQGRCGPGCRERCRRHEYCSEYNSCEPIPELSGPEHRGLLLRATTGYGFGTLAASDAGVREGNLMIGVGVDMGGSVIENLIVRGRIRGAVSYYRDSDYGSDVLFSFGTFGAGVDYYFMPINIYIGGTLSVAGISRTDEDHIHRSKAGLGLDLDVGKEWWVSRRWGIGIALRATYMDVAPAHILTASGIDKGDQHDSRLRSFHVGLQFSATFN